MSARARSGVTVAFRVAVAVAVVAALAVAELAVAGLIPSAAGAAPCTPLPPLIVCPPPDQPTPPPTTAALTISRASASGYTTAVLGATINPDGALTTYQWTLSDRARHAPQVQSEPAALPAASTPQTVQTTITGLQPGTTYDVTLQATSSAGQVSTAASLSTAQRARVMLGPPRPSAIPLGRLRVSLRARVTGEFSRYAPVQLEVATAPRWRWRAIGGQAPGSSRGTVVLPACPDRDVQDACPWMQRNFAVRAVDGRARSAVRRVSVDPLVDLSVRRERDGASPWLDATLAASVHPLHGRFHTQPVYFYEGASAHGPFTLARVGRFRVEDQTTLVASARIHHPDAGGTIACFRHRLLPDMGFPGPRPGCGRRTIR